MAKPPIFQIIERLKPLSLPHQIKHLQALVKAETCPKRKREIVSYLKIKLIPKELKREIKWERCHG